MRKTLGECRSCFLIACNKMYLATTNVMITRVLALSYSSNYPYNNRDELTPGPLITTVLSMFGNESWILQLQNITIKTDTSTLNTIYRDMCRGASLSSTETTKQASLLRDWAALFPKAMFPRPLSGSGNIHIPGPITLATRPPLTKHWRRRRTLPTRRPSPDPMQYTTKLN